MGILGYWFQRAGWARPPFVLAFVLGDILETNFQISNRAYPGYEWLGKYMVLILLAIIVVTVFFVAKGAIKQRRSGDGPVETGEGTEINPMLSMPLGALMVVVFAIAAVIALQWPLEVKQFPLVAAVPGAILAGWAVWRDQGELRATLRCCGSFMAAWHEASQKAMLPKAGLLIFYLACVLVLSLIIGQIAALALFMAVYLWRWGHYGWKMIFAYVACGVAFLWGFYDRLLHVHWLDSWLFS
jgi:hypothetical protein